MSRIESDKERFSIKLWAEDDRPREKLELKGRQALSDAELIAILIGSGTKKESAVELSKRILQSVNGDLNKLGTLSMKALMQFNGIGKAKAVSIMSALELGRRRKNTSSSKKPQVTSSRSAFEEIYPYLADHDHEEFYIMLLNRANMIEDVVRISQGGVSGTVADAKMIFRAAIDRLASAIILAHNHPSGNISPSQADVALTKKLVEGGRLLEVAVLDHLIVAGKEYYSFADEGMI